MHRAELICYATQRGCSYADAEDLVQEVWLKLARTQRIDEIHAMPADEQIAVLKMRLRSEMSKNWRNARAAKRGSGAVHVDLDTLLVPPSHCATPADDLHLTELRAALAGLDDLDYRERGARLNGAERVALHRRRKVARLALAQWRD